MKASNAFEILTLTKGKLIEIEVLSQKNREPNQNPGVKLTVEYVVANHALTMFDPSLKATLFTKNAPASAKDKTGTLDGVDPVSDMPNLSGIGQHVKAIKWAQEMTGYVCEIDHGRGGTSNIHLTGCVLDGWRFTPKEGGSVTVKHTIEAADASKSDFGNLATYKSREIEFTLAAPTVHEDLVDKGQRAPAPQKAKKDAPPPADPPAPAPAAAAGSTPESVLADAVKNGTGGSDPVAGEDPTQEAINKARESGNWPFKQGEADKAPEAPTDGNAEFAAGAQAAIEAARGAAAKTVRVTRK